MNLIHHLATPLNDGGHGIERNLPVTSPLWAKNIHLTDHRPDSDWYDVIQHTHEEKQ